MFKKPLYVALAGLALLTCFAACLPPEYGGAKGDSEKVNLDLRNPRTQRLYDLRDQGLTDSLLPYLKHKDATVRYLAALSFASVRDSTAIDQLALRLNDPVSDVRIAAAYALGQIGSRLAEKPLLAAFVAGDSLSEYQRFNAIVLEAVGKCGSRASLRNLVNISTYRPTDTLLLEGQCRAIYRFGLRDSIENSATALMVKYLTDERYPEPARLMAAHYLARIKGVATDSAQATLMAATFVRATESPNLRMAIATALGKSPTGSAFGILSKVIKTEQDWRVRCNLVNALGAFSYDTVRAIVAPLVFDSNAHVARTAATLFIEKGQPKDGDYYWRIAKNNPGLPWPVAVPLFQASNRWLSGRSEPESKDFVNFRLKEMFQNSKNPYERAACLTALAEFGWNYRWIHDRGFPDAQPAVKTAAAAALKTIAQRRDFYAFFGEAAKGARRELYYYFREMIGMGDVGMIAEAADALTAPALDYRTLRDSVRLTDLLAARQKISDYDAETAMAMDKTLAFFENRPAPRPVRPAFNHPIDWKVLTGLSPNPQATIQTPKGAVVLELLPHWAPGSVANFVKLAKSDYFSGKNFHRVVANHVVQGGCPRGDGYGGEKYTLRTEIALAWYDAEGYVGMASGGPDTEGTQWFITHSPRPHLDGKYTIFAKVVKGMDVVHRLQMGDTMDRILIQ